MDAAVFNTAVDGGDAVITVEFALVRHIMLELEYDAVGWGADCNGNGVPDACDVNNGTSDDCRSHGIPDECNTFVSTSPQLSPVIHPVVQHHTITAPPRAVGEVSLFFAACCVGYYHESIDVDINGTPVGRVYRNRENWGIPQLDVLPVPAALFNAAVGDGDAVINMTPTPEVNYLWPDSFVSVTVQYPVAQLADCQPNGISDACDLADGLSTDCDGDGMPDECEPDADSDSIPDDCDQPGDFDHDADVDLADYKLLWVCLLLSGPGELVPFAECREAFDADRDGDIDLQDVADFTRRLAP
ncbi:MAG: hypothetical protein IIC51_08170 [Planctomycetes bacterium]|nr:hypothetical protein [Planctomycetota bacterium]